MDGHTYRWRDRRTDGGTDGWMYIRIDGETERQMDG
jgi:hypothetical protein